MQLHALRWQVHVIIARVASTVIYITTQDGNSGMHIIIMQNYRIWLAIASYVLYIAICTCMGRGICLICMHEPEGTHVQYLRMSADISGNPDCTCYTWLLHNTSGTLKICQSLATYNAVATNYFFNYNNRCCL